MKIKYSIIEKLKNLTASEWALFLYAVKCQEEATGMVRGLYYRDVMKETKMCKQSFYNALEGLKRKQIITVEKNSDVDYDITIIGNDFPWKGDPGKTYEEGYVSLARDAFHRKAFKELKPHAKYLLLEFCKRTHEGRHSFHIGIEKLYEKWSEMLGVTERVIRGYLHALKKFFEIKKKNGQYDITYLDKVFQKREPHDPMHKSEIMYFYEALVRKECNRQHIAYDDDTLQDTAELIGQYRMIAGGIWEIHARLQESIQRTVAGTLRKDRKLQPKFVHMQLKGQLNMA